eukprot:ctg_1492.g541
MRHWLHPTPPTAPSAHRSPAQRSTAPVKEISVAECASSAPAATWTATTGRSPGRPPTAGAVAGRFSAARVETDTARRTGRHQRAEAARAIQGRCGAVGKADAAAWP